VDVQVAEEDLRLAGPLAAGQGVEPPARADLRLALALDCGWAARGAGDFAGRAVIPAAGSQRDKADHGDRKSARGDIGPLRRVAIRTRFSRHARSTDRFVDQPIRNPARCVNFYAGGQGWNSEQIRTVKA